MEDAVTTATRVNGTWLSALATHVRAEAPSLACWGAAIVSSILLIVSFPDFDLWPIAWLGLVPLLVVIARRPAAWRAFILGWLFGGVFFYGSCHWLTYSMVHYGHIPAWISYLLLIPGAFTLGLFPGLFALVLARGIKKWGRQALFAAPLVWSSLEWARLATTGQLWNAIGYSQAYQPMLIQSARWGGVYFVGFLIVSLNAAIAFLLLKRTIGATTVAAGVVAGAVVVIFAAQAGTRAGPSSSRDTADLVVVALQPNVPMDPVKSSEEIRELTLRHLEMSEGGLGRLTDNRTRRLVIWPESPMNFAYSDDSQFRELLAEFSRQNNASVLFNSQEPAPQEGLYNSALLVNEQGSLIAQYDKIRLLPFGEYVPLPRWLPGAGLIRAIVGDFTPGTKYTVMPVGAHRAGVFICIESAYPSIARKLTSEGADVLINISNDGYLGRTAVMRQHLANAVFRAVENGLPLLRVTNTGISAYITAEGEVKDATSGFQPAVRTWTLAHSGNSKTFYTKHGDLFAGTSGLITLLIFAASFVARPR
jgi:apolipoprotein N-acyltransferase